MTGPAFSGRTSDDDLLALLAVGVLAIGGAGTFAATRWSILMSWLLAHQVLLAASTRPLLVVPHTDGAGLDLPRVALVAAAVLLLIAVVVGAVRQRLQQRRALQ